MAHQSQRYVRRPGAFGCCGDGKRSVCRQVKAAHLADRFAMIKVCATDGSCKLADTWHRSGEPEPAIQSGS